MKAALDYGRLGWSVIPIEPRGTRPLVAWEVYQHRQQDSAEVADWFRRWPNANLGVVTGVVSSLIVLEIDRRAADTRELAKLDREIGPNARTVQAKVGQDLRQLYFAHPGAITRSRIAEPPGFYLRGDGDYVVAPPSIHAGGEPYQWESSPVVTPLAPLADSILDSPVAPPPGSATPASAAPAVRREPVAGEERYQAIASLARHLLSHGVDTGIATDLLSSWDGDHCRPPVGAAEVRRAVESAALSSRSDD